MPLREQLVTHRRDDALSAGATPATWSGDGGGVRPAASAGVVGASGSGWGAPVARPASTGAVIFWLIVATLAVSAVAIYVGSSGYPVFGLGLGFGFAVGAIPYGLLVLAHASATEIVTTRSGRRRRMTDEEWQRIFGPRSFGPGAWTAEGPHTGPGWSERASGPALDEQAAYDRLELAPGATLRQVTRAYHRLAHRYHPDLTAGRPEPERALSEQKMRELNAAYELLRRRLVQAPIPGGADL
jgi:hypothetical protein